MRPLAIKLMTLISLFVAAASGCNERVGGGPHESNLRLIAVLYSQYMAAHDGQAPQNTEDFRAYAQSLGPGVLQRAGMSGLDELFTSARDGQPFAIKCQAGNWHLDGAIAYEQIGAGGTRFVATELGGVSEVSEVVFQGRLKARN